MLYGIGVTGISDTHLKEARATVHASLYLRPGKRSATADLSFARPGCTIDPAIEARTAPVRTYVAAAWEGWCPRHILARAFVSAKEAIDKKAAEQSPTWQAVIGPVGAMYASLLRIGWSASKPFFWTTGAGVQVDVLNTSARDIATLFQRSVQDWLWRRSGGFATRGISCNSA